MSSAQTTTARPSLVGRFFRNPDTGEVVVFQMPNIPLWIFLAATAARLVFHPNGAVGTAISIIGSVSLVVWAAFEIARGESPFRRVLGAVVLVAVVVGLLTR
jgi:ABC-type glycerol-3-phosphate transport system permease component